MNASRRWLALGLLGLVTACGAPGPAGAPVRHLAAREPVRIRQFGRIVDARHPERRLYRGGQPSDEGLRQLAELGVKTIVSLQDVRDMGEEAADVAHERAVAARLGMTFLNLPIAGDGLPTEEAIARFLEVARTSDRRPVFVHCEWGRDRTGLMVALYRIREAGYSVDAALAEMESFGYEPERYPEPAEFLRAYARASGSRGASSWLPAGTVPLRPTRT